MYAYQTKRMAVQQEIKSHLARLLATEDLVVEHKNVECAQFDVRTRVLTLPLWEKASHDVYDMLVGHEVGHAFGDRSRREYMYGRACTIYGGSNEVQKNIIAKFGLGL